MKTLLALAVFAALTPLAAAQQQLRPNPADPAAAVPTIRHESQFADYVAYREQDIAPWHEVNEEVARAGGHVGIFGGHGAHSSAKPAAKPLAAGNAGKPEAALQPKPIAKKLPAAADRGKHH